jgi:outer membrane protein assembly factor BamE
MPSSLSKTLWALVTLIAFASLSACAGKLPLVYRVPVQQGNVITVEMLQQLELGMDKRKVTFILGTPLIIDAFHQNRWDYFYSYEPSNARRVQQQASLYFENDRLARIDASIDSKIDFHTVTEASENVLVVPRKKKGGFFAAITPGFLKKEEQDVKQEKIAQSLGSGVNPVQPGSGVATGPGATGEVPGPVAAAPVVIGPTLGAATPPNEIYAPNSSAQFNATGAWSTQAKSATETISPETASQTRYLEQLFDGFGATPTPVAASAPAPEPEAAVTGSKVLTGTTRD